MQGHENRGGHQDRDANAQDLGKKLLKGRAQDKGENHEDKLDKTTDHGE